MPFTISDFFESGFVGKYYFTNPQAEGALVWFVVSVAVLIISAYLLGSINFAIIISGKTYKQDIRNFGSKNAGMTNMMRTYGKKAAALTLGGDALKAIVSCLLGYALLGQLGAYIAGLFCISGHIFPVFYGFRGGKGVVTAAATILMCDPIVFVILFLIFVIIVALTKYISLGSVMCMLLYPILQDTLSKFALKIIGGSQYNPYVIFPFCMMLLIVLKHWPNIKRLLAGKESKFSFKKSVKAPEESKSENAEATNDSDTKNTQA